MADLKLSEAQKRALSMMKGSSAKSGAFWSDLGISLSTLAALEARGMVESGGHWRPRLCSWVITPSGVYALESFK